MHVETHVYIYMERIDKKLYIHTYLIVLVKKKKRSTVSINQEVIKIVTSRVQGKRGVCVKFEFFMNIFCYRGLTLE